VSTFLSITFSGLALAGVYFLCAAGLTLIFGLMDILNFAQGVFITLGAYAGYEISIRLPGSAGAVTLFVFAIAGAIVGGALAAGITEVVLIRPLYGRPMSQVLVTIGLDLAIVALLEGIFGSNEVAITVPTWVNGATHVGQVVLPNAAFLALGAGVIVLVSLEMFLRRTRYGIIIRAGVENRGMVSALGIDVGRAFTLVFVIGGALAGLAGLLNTIAFNSDFVTPIQGDSLLIFTFIVVVVGGLGSIRGAAVSAVVIALLQNYTNYYLGSHPGWSQVGNLSVVLLLAVVLSVRPRGLFASIA
jgi:branched-chain amino acid transport system permease protein